MSLKTILRRLSSPLLQVNGQGIALAFDAELQVDRGGERTYTESRIGAGVDISDHSFALPRRYEIEGGVSGLSQLHNFARPGFNGLGALVGAGLDFLEGLTGLDFSTRIQDFEERLEAVREAGDILEIVSKVIGRKQVVLLSWHATTAPADGEQAKYRMTFKEVQRAGLSIAGATAEGLALNGSGGGVVPGGGGPSTATPGTLDVEP